MLKKLGDSFRRQNLRPLVQIVVALVFFIAYIYVCVYTEADKLNAGITVCVCYIAASIIIWLLSSIITRGMNAASAVDNSSPLGNLTLDVLAKLRQPVVICDDSGAIVWYNRELSRIAGRGTLYGADISALCSASISDISAAESAEGLDVTAFGKPFGIRAYKISSQGKNYIFTIWHDKSELETAYRRMADESTVVAYIMIDNLEELMQYVQEKYRAASGEIETVLKNWADSVDGILMEYERDRYFFIFDALHLSQFIDDRFSVLDRVRSIRVGEGSLPVTLSIGVSGVVGSYAEKENAARTSLDMALQRGGDQAVVRTDSGLEFFGGRSKSVQKRTKVRARVVANELAVLISGSSNVLIMGHRNMDFDALGSCIGLARLVMFCGVNVHIIANVQDGNLQKCFEKIKSLPEYANIFVSAADAQEMLSSETLLIIADVNNKTQYEAPDVAANAFTTVIIDHHRKTEEFKNQPAIAYIEPSASSASELVSEILEQSMPAGQLKPDEAEIMFAGILLDTKQFSRNTGARTFSAALYLRSEGANPAVSQALFKTDLDDFMREAHFMFNVTMYRDFLAFAVNNDDGNTQTDRIAAAKAADRLLTIEGVQASFALCRIGGTIIISARSSGVVNVQLILEKLGGGGHFDAAATQLEDTTMDEALTKLKSAIDEYIEEL